MTQIEILKNFESLSPKQRLMVAKKIQIKMSDELFADFNMELPDIDMSESEIMQEVKAVREHTKRHWELRYLEETECILIPLNL
ncbi:MAG: hypothetical protein U5N85_20220 [Arcicella sp.]|nr:hypothetical protein [Arcicella sp.]